MKQLSSAHLAIGALTQAHWRADALVHVGRVDAGTAARRLGVSRPAFLEMLSQVTAARMLVEGKSSARNGAGKAARPGQDQEPAEAAAGVAARAAPSRRAAKRPERTDPVSAWDLLSPSAAGPAAPMPPRTAKRAYVGGTAQAVIAMAMESVPILKIARRLGRSVGSVANSISLARKRGVPIPRGARLAPVRKRADPTAA